MVPICMTSESKKSVKLLWIVGLDVISACIQGVEFVEGGMSPIWRVSPHMRGCPPRWGASGSQMVHFSAIAMIYKEKVVPFPDIIRGTFVLTNIDLVEKDAQVWNRRKVITGDDLPE